MSTDDIFPIIIEHFPDIMHSVDPEGNILFSNLAAENILGYSRDELLSMNVRELYADDVLEEMKQGFKSLKQEGDMSIESALKDKEGNRIPVEIRSFSIYNDEGEFLRTFSIIRDVRIVKGLQEGLVHAERLAAIGELASGIAHDINNPSHVIQMCTGGMIEDLSDDSKQLDDIKQSTLKYADYIQKAVGTITKLVQHLLDFSRGVKEEEKTIDLYDSINDALFLVGSRLRRCGVKVVNDIESGTHYVRGAENRLQQIFANFFSNASDAMDDLKKRVLTVRIDSFEAEGIEYWCCSIKDTGTGIDPKNLEKLYESFFTTKAKGKGSGLGLSIARGIVKDHQGTIEVTSEVGKGTEFRIFLPKYTPG